MNLQPVTSPTAYPVSLPCSTCGKLGKATDMLADLDGPPFAAYYHKDCAPRPPVSLWCAYLGDDYLAAATKNGQGGNTWYWEHSLRHASDFRIVYYHNVPAEMAENLCFCGTSEQKFGDGYLAHVAIAALNLETVLVHENDFPEMDTYDPGWDDTLYECDECGADVPTPGLCDSCAQPWMSEETR